MYQYIMCSMDQKCVQFIRESLASLTPRISRSGILHSPHGSQYPVLFIILQTSLKKAVCSESVPAGCKGPEDQWMIVSDKLPKLSVPRHCQILIELSCNRSRVGIKWTSVLLWRRRTIEWFKNLVKPGNVSSRRLF